MSQYKLRDISLTVLNRVSADLLGSSVFLELQIWRKTTNFEHALDDHAIEMAFKMWVLQTSSEVEEPLRAVASRIQRCQLNGVVI